MAFTPQQEKQMREMRERGQKFREGLGKPHIPTLVGTPLPPLVRQITPQPIDRPKHEAIHIVPITNRKLNMNKSADSDGNFTISGFKSFYDFLKLNENLYKSPVNTELQNFVNFVESIDRACGCVRGTLNEKGADIYARMLPLMQVSNPEVFSAIKEISQATKIIFKEGDLTLLEIV